MIIVIKKPHKGKESEYNYNADGMKEYIETHGKHFNKKMYEFAVHNMYNNKGFITPMNKQEFERKMRQYNITLSSDCCYDAMYCYSMCMADFYGSSIPDESHAFMFVKDMIDDIDQPEGYVFNRFYSDCILKNISIDWCKMI